MFGALPPNRTQTLTHSGASELAQLMEGSTAGALIPEIVRRGFQDLLEAEVSGGHGQGSVVAKTGELTVEPGSEIHEQLVC